MAAANRPARFSDLLCDTLVVTTHVTDDLLVTGNLVGILSVEASSADTTGILYLGGNHDRSLHRVGEELMFEKTGAAVFTMGALNDWLVGTDKNLMDSVGTPTYGSGFGGSATITGTDYAMKVIPNSDAPGVITFGHTFDHEPVVVANVIGSAAQPQIVATTTNITITNPTAAYVGGWMILVRGF